MHKLQKRMVIVIVNVPDNEKKKNLLNTIASLNNLSKYDDDDDLGIPLGKECIASTGHNTNCLSNHALIAPDLFRKKNFNKAVFFSNVRELLRQNPDMKIGQIEKDAGVQPGYMSRLEKEDNSADPSMEFIATVAKLLNVSVNTLISSDITALSSQEKFIVEFFYKLKADTIADKLNWLCETAFELNNIKTKEYDNFDTSHPLIIYAYGCEYEGKWYESGIRFTSKSFGPNTYFNGDCFNLRLKNGTRLYLMNIRKDTYSSNDPNKTAIEAWIVNPNSKNDVLVTSYDKSQIVPMLLELYETIKGYMDRPRLNKEALYAIDAFMKDDLTDDPIDNDDVPF